VCVEHSERLLKGLVLEPIRQRLESDTNHAPFRDQAGGYQRRLVEEGPKTSPKAAQETEAAFFSFRDIDNFNEFETTEGSAEIMDSGPYKRSLNISGETPHGVVAACKAVAFGKVQFDSDLAHSSLP
jgi:hypothetical protein